MYILKITEKEKRMLEWILKDVQDLVVSASGAYTNTDHLVDLRNKVVWAILTD